MSTTTYDYWKLGTGNPFHDGCCGYDSETTDNGMVVGRTRTRPPGAVSLDQAQWDALQAEIVTEGEAIVVDGDAWIAQQQAEKNALMASARGKLVAGQPLTADEAAVLTGGP